LTKREKITILITVILIIVAYIFGLFIDVTRDAAKYAYISKEISDSGNWFRITIMGESYDQKPQFLFWLSAFSFKILGTSNFTFKLPIFLYSLLGCFAVFKLGESIYNRKTGFMAALIILFSVIFLLYNMDIHTDTVLFTNVALSLWMLQKYLSIGNRVFLVGSGIAMGISFLTKGPFGVFIPVISTLAYLISQKRIPKISISNIILLFLTFSIIASLALIPFYIDKGFKGIWFFLWENNFKRVIGHYEGGSDDYFFYLHNLLYLLLPWSIFLITGLFFIFKDLFKRKFSSNDHFIFWGLLSFLLLISFSRNKLPNYLMSALPLLAIITAQGWNEVFSRGLRKILLIHKVIIYIFISLLFIIPVFILQDRNMILWSIVLLVTLLSVIFIKTASRESTLQIKTLIAMVSIALFLNLYLYPLLINLQGAPKAAKIINEKSLPGEKIYYLYPEGINARDNRFALSKLSSDNFNGVLTELHFFRNYEFMFYCKNPVLYIERMEQVGEITCDGNSWVYTDHYGLEKLKKCYAGTFNVFPISNVELKNPIKYINHKTRKQSIEEMFLVHLENNKPN
jgi:4-amino-4-deoxy-L-arabinose transferase-like glycosyltransferase